MAWPIIDQEEHEGAANTVNTAIQLLNDLLSDYINALTGLTNEAIKVHNTSAALISYAQQAAKIQQIILQIAEIHTSANERFLANIVAADQEI